MQVENCSVVYLKFYRFQDITQSKKTLVLFEELRGEKQKLCMC